MKVNPERDEIRQALEKNVAFSDTRPKWISSGKCMKARELLPILD